MSTPLDHHVFQHTGPLELKGGSPGPSLEPGILLYNSAAFRRRAGVSATKQASTGSLGSPDSHTMAPFYPQ